MFKGPTGGHHGHGRDKNEFPAGHKLRALYIEKRFMSNEPGETVLAESELAALHDRFCEEYRDFITPPMARAVKKDFNTFLVLIDWTFDYYKKAGD